MFATAIAIMISLNSAGTVVTPARCSAPRPLLTDSTQTVRVCEPATVKGGK